MGGLGERADREIDARHKDPRVFFFFFFFFFFFLINIYFCPDPSATMPAKISS
jgi:hypothetical protein